MLICSSSSRKYTWTPCTGQAARQCLPLICQKQGPPKASQQFNRTERGPKGNIWNHFCTAQEWHTCPCPRHFRVPRVSLNSGSLTVVGISIAWRACERTLLGPSPNFWWSLWSRSQEFGFLTSPQEMEMLLVLGSHFENHWPRKSTRLSCSL